MQQGLASAGLAIFVSALAACGNQQPASTVGPALSTKNMPPVAGQQKTCAGPREKTFDVDVIETTGIDLGTGISFAAWGYNGRVPGPTIETCQGDTVTINVHDLVRMYFVNVGPCIGRARHRDGARPPLCRCAVDTGRADVPCPVWFWCDLGVLHS